MTRAELFWEGINLMFVGMGFVMIFLWILIYAISGISQLIARFFPEEQPAAPAFNAVSPTPVAAAQTVSDEMVRLRPVIVAAVAHHRRQQGLK